MYIRKWLQNCIILICRHKDHPFFKQFYHGPNRFAPVQRNRSPRKTYLEYTNIQITRANHYGNTPRRAYTIRKTVTRIQCGYILINQKQYNYDTVSVMAYQAARTKGIAKTISVKL